MSIEAMILLVVIMSGVNTVAMIILIWYLKMWEYYYAKYKECTANVKYLGRIAEINDILIDKIVRMLEMSYIKERGNDD